MLKEFLLFNFLITPWLIRIIYWILQLLIIFLSIKIIFGEVLILDFYLISGFLEGILFLIFGSLFLRLSTESLIIFFKISENIQELKKNT